MKEHKFSVVFLCDRNTVRSPMAAAILNAGSPQRADPVGKPDLTKPAESAGINADDMVDPFACAAMFEEGLDITGHTPRTIDPKALKSGDLVIALSLPAFETAQKWRAKTGFDLEYWALPGVPEASGTRDTILDGYRAIVKALKAHIANRFAKS